MNQRDPVWAERERERDPVSMVVVSIPLDAPPGSFCVLISLDKPCMLRVSRRKNRRASQAKLETQRATIVGGRLALGPQCNLLPRTLRPSGATQQRQDVLVELHHAHDLSAKLERLCVACFRVAVGSVQRAWHLLEQHPLLHYLVL